MSAPRPDVVELRDVHLSFDEKKVLDGVSLEVEPLDRLVVMGQSGSGKSTILRLILGILKPERGSVFFKQFEISRLNRRKLQQVRAHIGMVYQYSALLSSRSVRDNVALPLEELLGRHPSIQRNVVGVPLPLLCDTEANEILDVSSAVSCDQCSSRHSRNGVSSRKSGPSSHGHRRYSR